MVNKIDSEAYVTVVMLERIRKASRKQLEDDLKRVDNQLLLEKISPTQLGKEALKSLKAWREAIVNEMCERDYRRERYIKNKGL